jgi:tRNA threonylcarbamoyladenosine modification (KEOPS) complex  Pcc1 subunit
MKSKELAEAIWKSMREEVEQFIEQESQITSSLEYEERVLELSRKFAKDLIAKSQGKMPKSRNSKKSPDQFGSS